MLRALVFIFTFIISTLIALPVHAGDFIVLSVVRDFPMKQGEVLYKDFYINAGTNNGLRKGIVLDASRKMPVFDNINSKMISDLSIKVAKLKVIHVDKNYAIARLVKFYEKENTPLAVQEAVMMGDQVEVSDKQ